MSYLLNYHQFNLYEAKQKINDQINKLTNFYFPNLNSKDKEIKIKEIDTILRYDPTTKIDTNSKEILEIGEYKWIIVNTLKRTNYNLFNTNNFLDLNHKINFKEISFTVKEAITSLYFINCRLKIKPILNINQTQNTKEDLFTLHYKVHTFRKSLHQEISHSYNNYPYIQNKNYQLPEYLKIYMIYSHLGSLDIANHFNEVTEDLNKAKWCTAYESNIHFHQYASESPLYVFINTKTHEMYQFNFHNKELEDKDKENLLTPKPDEDCVDLNCQEYDCEPHLDDNVVEYDVYRINTFTRFIYNDESNEYILKYSGDNNLLNGYDDSNPKSLSFYNNYPKSKSFNKFVLQQKDYTIKDGKIYDKEDNLVTRLIIHMYYDSLKEKYIITNHDIIKATAEDDMNIILDINHDMNNDKTIYFNSETKSIVDKDSLDYYNPENDEKCFGKTYIWDNMNDVECNNINNLTYDKDTGEFDECTTYEGGEDIEDMYEIQKILEDKLILENDSLDFLFDNNFRKDTIEKDYKEKYEYFKNLNI